MGDVVLFPASRIAKASAEIFARRTQWENSDETANEILASMAGNPIPPLGIRRIYNLEKESLIDIAEQLRVISERLIDHVE